MAATDNDVLSTTSKAAFQWGARLAAVERQRDNLLAACEELCAAIKLVGSSHCDTYHDGPSLGFIEQHWVWHVPVCEGDAYRAGQAAIAAVRGNQ